MNCEHNTINFDPSIEDGEIYCKDCGQKGTLVFAPIYENKSNEAML